MVSSFIAHAFRLQMMSGTRQVDAFAHQPAEIHFDPLMLPALLRRLSRLEHLLDRSEQPVGIVQHQPVELLAAARHRRPGSAKSLDKAGSTRSASSVHA